MKVLYVEDDACDAELVQRALGRSAGAFEVRWAKTLLEALPQLAEVDLVLTDLRLPDGSGLELLAVIRERRLEVAVVLLTGAGDESTVMAAIKGGVDDYVAKRSDYLDRLPVVLTSAVERCRSHTRLRLRPLRVVYAEHNVADADLTLRHVARHTPHILIEIVPNAETVLALLARSPDRFDVVLLDYRLQGLDALNALKELRETLHSDVPVVLVTGQGNEEIATQALRLGVTDYLIKHVGYLYQLTAVLEGAHQRRQLARDQAALQASETHFRVLFEQAADAIGLLDPQRTFLDLNASGVQLLGWTREELLGRPVSELLVPTEPVRFAAVRASVQADAIVTEEWRLRRKDGQILEVEATIRRLPDGRWLVVGRDVTLRKQTERALQRQQEALLRLNEAAALPVFDPQQVLLQTLLIATRHLQMEYGVVCHALGAQGQIEAQVTPAGAQTVNHAFVLEGSYCQLPLVADDLVARPQVAEPLVSPCLSGVTASAYLGVPLQVDGETFGTLNFLSTQPRPAAFDPADLDFVRLLARTVAATLQRREALARLRESESRLAGIIDTAMDAIISVNEDQCILVFNDAAEKIFHCPAGEALGRALQQFLPDALLAEQIAHLREDGAQARTLGQPCRLQGRRTDGGEFPCEASISQVEVNGHRLLTVILRDLTERTQAEAERKALETQMLRAQRLESVGRLAGGIAHDLNNILSPVLLGTSLLREYVSNPLALDTLQAMEQSTRRGHHPPAAHLQPGQRRRARGGQFRPGGSGYGGHHHGDVPQKDRVALRTAGRSLASDRRPHPVAPGRDEPVRQCPRCHARGRQSHAHDAKPPVHGRTSRGLGGRPARAVPASDRGRHGHRYRPRAPREDLRPLLYDQGGRAGHRSGPVDGPGDREEPPGCRAGRFDARRRDELSHLPAGVPRWHLARGHARDDGPAHGQRGNDPRRRR